MDFFKFFEVSVEEALDFSWEKKRYREIAIG
jgi:hypothetical protein